MLSPDRVDLPPLRVGYVVKRYPRFSETFIVNEILAHEAAGLEIKIFALRPSIDEHFQDRIARVRAPVKYLPCESLRASEFWADIHEASAVFPGFWPALQAAREEEAIDVYQAIVLAQQIRSQGIGHLHAHFATSAATVARLAARLANVPYSLTAHAKDIFHESVAHNDLQHKLRDAAAVITVSDFNLHYLRETYGSAAERVRRVYNGLDLGDFPYISPKDRPPRIMAVGRLIEKKGFGDLIEACAILAHRNQDFTCQIIGTGELAEPLRTQIERLGLQSKVQLLGSRPQAEVIQLVQSAAVFAAPCVIGADGNRDGLPTVLLEAMALGTPCVSTDVTGIPEVLHDEQTGLMVPQHEPAALAAAIQRLLADRELGVRLAGPSRSLIEAEFDIHRNAARIRDIFQGVGEGDGEAAMGSLQEVG